MIKKTRRTRQSKLNFTSFTKSFLSSHYHYAHFPAVVDDICVKNALRFSLFDTNAHIWTFNRLDKFFFPGRLKAMFCSCNIWAGCR